MANITSVTGYITILAKKKEDAIKFIYLVNKHLNDGEYYICIQNFAKMDIKQISDNFYKEIERNYKLNIDLNQYKDFIPYTVLFYGAGRWLYYNNIENLKSWMKESASRVNDKESLKMIEDIAKTGIKIVFDYTEEDTARLCTTECVNVIDFKKGEECLEISVKHQIVENLKNFCGYDECVTLTARKNLNRNAIGIEFNIDYFNNTKIRLNNT